MYASLSASPVDPDHTIGQTCQAGSTLANTYQHWAHIANIGPNQVRPGPGWGASLIFRGNDVVLEVGSVVCCRRCSTVRDDGVDELRWRRHGVRALLCFRTRPRRHGLGGLVCAFRLGQRGTQRLCLLCPPCRFSIQVWPQMLEFPPSAPEFGNVVDSGPTLAEFSIRPRFGANSGWDDVCTMSVRSCHSSHGI